MKSYYESDVYKQKVLDDRRGKAHNSSSLGSKKDRTGRFPEVP